MAGEIQAKVKKEVAPINGGFRVLLENGIAELEDEIARLEYRRDTDENFTQLDAQDLTTKKRRLAKNREALAVLKNASNGTADG